MKTHPRSILRSLAHVGLVLACNQATLAATDTQATRRASLLDDPDVAKLGWVADFSYLHQTLVAQRKRVVVYSLPMIKAHVKSLIDRKLPWVMPAASSDGNFVLGRSYGWPGEPKIEPQPLFGYQITDPRAPAAGKLKIILAAGNHPREDPSNWAFHGLVEFLVSNDPRAKTLREKVIFHVYPSINPDGKLYLLSQAHDRLMSTNSNPQLKAAGGETNHNRVWETNGKFTDIDAFKAAWRKDTGGRADYFFDFHGIPQTTIVFGCDLATPLGRALLARGFNTRPVKRADGEGMTLRAWSMGADGVANATFTPEIASGSMSKMLLTGQAFALAIHDMLAGVQLPFPHTAKAALTPRKPPAPPSAWLLDGDTAPAAKNGGPAETNSIDWAADAPFKYPGNKSIRLDKDDAFVDFGNDRGLDSRQNLTVSLWAKGDSRNGEPRCLFSRHNAKDDRRAWALMQVSDSPETLVHISADGSGEGSKIKRYLSAQWPLVTLFDGTWRHLAFVFEGGAKNGVLKVYVDGREIQREHGMHLYSDGVVPALFDSPAPVRIGATQENKDSFQGQIDETAIWPAALSPEEIRWLSENSLNALLNK